MAPSNVSPILGSYPRYGLHRYASFRWDQTDSP